MQNAEIREEIGAAQQYATRAFFFIGGFGVASWAPLVPLLKARLGIGEDVLGLLLLCIGIGSLLTMPFSGVATARFGCRRVIGTAVSVYALLLPVLCLVDNLWLAAVSLLCFGAVMGLIDVAINIHAVIVEKAADKPLMSGMHAFWSIGGFCGAGAFGALMQVGFTPFQSTLSAVGLMSILTVIFIMKILHSGAQQGSAGLAIPRGIVAFIGIIACIAFLTEGAVMDWSGVFLTEIRSLPVAMAGTGFAVFSAAMLCMRLGGDWLIKQLGSRLVVYSGIIISAVGFVMIIMSAQEMLMYGGFFLIGIGSANIVPVFFSMLGNQTEMPLSMAVSAVGTMGYLGVLMGPAAIGFIAHQIGLIMSFVLLTALVMLQLPIAVYAYKKLN